jgi:hypothetical protein
LSCIKESVSGQPSTSWPVAAAAAGPSSSCLKDRSSFLKDGSSCLKDGSSSTETEKPAPKNNQVAQTDADSAVLCHLQCKYCAAYNYTDAAALRAHLVESHAGQFAQIPGLQCGVKQFECPVCQSFRSKVMNFSYNTFFKIYEVAPLTTSVFILIFVIYSTKIVSVKGQ